ncbi:MAG: antitoxin [Actinobacteria bacterium]|nr:antitoxin [Actinomycetota bacterium]
MRTTIDLPREIHAIASSIARDRGCTLSIAVADLIRRGLDPGARIEQVDPRTGFPLLASEHTVTSTEVRDLLDDE